MSMVQQVFLLLVGAIVSGVSVFVWMDHKMKKHRKWRDEVVRHLDPRDVPTGEFPVVRRREG